MGTKPTTLRAMSVSSYFFMMFVMSCTPAPGGRAVFEDQLRVAAVFATPIDEPWDRAVHAALEMAEDSLEIEYEWTDAVTASAYERVLTDYAEEGYHIIIGDAFAAEEIARRVALRYPDIAFVFGSGLGPAEPNFSVFDNWIHEPAYLAGLMAGHLTRSGVVGVVGGYPVPEVNRILNAFLAGAREVNPEIRSRIAFINSWFDPAAAHEVARAMIQEGVDVLYAERDGVIEAAAEEDIIAFGNLIDQRSKAPDHVVTSVIWNMWPTIEQVIERVRSGTYRAEDYGGWSMLSKGGASLAPFGAWEQRLGKELVDLIAERTADILGGRFRVVIDESVPVSTN